MEITPQSPRSVVIAGIERSGKSSWAEKWAARCGRPVFLYNAGDDGFEDYKELNFLTIQEQANYLDISSKEINRFRYSAGACDFFEIEGKIYKASDFTIAMHRHGRVKMYGALNGKDDRDFFVFLARYAKGIAVILDDTRAIFRNGLKSEHISLMSRKSHTGRHVNPRFTPKKRGCELVFIFHNIDRVNPEIWDYTSHVVMFQCSQAPADNIDNKAAAEAISKAYQYLLSAPKYTHIAIGLKGQDAYKIKTFNAQGQPIQGPKQ